MIIEGVLNIRSRQTFDNVSVRDIYTQYEDNLPLVLSYHTGFKKFDFTPIEKINKICTVAEYTEPILMIRTVNSFEIERTVMCTLDTVFYTRNRSFVPVEKLSKAFLCVDEEDRNCKVLSVEEVKPASDAMIFDIQAKYNNNFCCNGMLVR